VEELRIAMEIEHGVDIPKSFPMKGGSLNRVRDNDPLHVFAWVYMCVPVHWLVRVWYKCMNTYIPIPLSIPISVFIF